VIHTDAVEEAFRGVDRRLFVPKNMQYMAHTDQPLKEGHIHISAPHIYGAIVESMELTPNSSLSFLNLGCGTGYLSSIVAHILGPTSRHVGIEINRDAVEHCKKSIDVWKKSCDRKTPMMDVIHGNVLSIETDQGEAQTGFDRMYVGASVENEKLPGLVKMLRLGGIFVGPVDDELVKVVRISKSSEDTEESPNRIPRSFRGHRPPTLSTDFSMQVVSSVRFTPLLRGPTMRTIISSQVWDPSIHQSYPDSFRRSCKEIMLCARSSTIQAPPPPTPAVSTNVAAKLPRAVWMEVLSYTDRTWFEKPPAADEKLLRQRLLEEQSAAQQAQEARLQAESRLHSVERERDVYRLLALRWQSRLQAVLRERGATADDEAMVGMDDFAEVASNAFANEPLLLRLGSLSALMRQFQQDQENEDESVPDADDESDNMDEEEEFEDDDDEDSDEAMSVTRSESPLVHPGRGSQARTVSLAEEDFSA